MKSIVICCSNKFAQEATAFAGRLRELGANVIEPYYYDKSGGDWSRLHPFDKQFVAMGLTRDHFHKISLADVVFFYNLDGYFGNSTTMELGFAAALGKPVYALSDKDPELCRKILIREFVGTPEELVKKL
ncbi:hypothetical protein HY224_01025 [Candidatus Uhrbacteria bacterium]|nr:hypothetical protein [Candidatus Uhrbacteria bacterium]